MTYRIDLALNNPLYRIVLRDFPGNTAVSAANYKNLKITTRHHLTALNASQNWFHI
jgi:hypothetical protein